MEEAGDPLAAVAVRVDVVLPVGPLLLLDELELLELLPPPQAAAVTRTATAATAKAALHRRSFFRVAARNPRKKMLDVTITPASKIQGRGALTGPSMLAVVVFTVTVTGIPVVAEVEDVNTTELGLKLHVAAVGRPEQDRLTVPLNPFTG